LSRQVEWEMSRS